MIRPMTWLAKEVVKGYIDLIGAWVILVGLACLVIGGILAYFGMGGFAMGFMAIGVFFVLLGYAGSKLMEWLLR